MHHRWGLGAATAVQKKISVSPYATYVILAEKEVKLERGETAPSRVVTRADALLPRGYRSLSVMDISPSDVLPIRRNLGFQVHQIVVRIG